MSCGRIGGVWDIIDLPHSYTNEATELQVLLRGCSVTEDKLQHRPHALLYINTVHIAKEKMATMRMGRPLPMVSIPCL